MAAGGDKDPERKTWPVFFCALLISVSFCVILYLAVSQSSQLPRLITRATVDSATLSRLTVVSNASASAAAVSYHLTVRLNLYNPGVGANDSIYYYDTIDAELHFSDAVIGGPFANGTSPSDKFYQRRGKTGDEAVTLDLDYDGRGSVTVGSDVAAELEKEVKSVGTVRLELDLVLVACARVRYGRYGVLKLQQMEVIWRSMNIPVKPDGGGALASGDSCKHYKGKGASVPVPKFH